MAMDQLNALCEQLVKAVTIMMDPSSTQRYRLEALKVAADLAPRACRETLPRSPGRVSPTRPPSLLLSGRGGRGSRPRSPPSAAGTAPSLR